MRLDAQRRSAHRNLGHKWITNFSKYLCRSRPEKRLLSKLRWGQRPGSEACGKFKNLRLAYSKRCLALCRR